MTLLLTVWEGWVFPQNNVGRTPYDMLVPPACLQKVYR